MAYAQQRSMNGSLADGMTDGTYKKLNLGRGGFVETTTEETRADLSPINFGHIETGYKEQPDGTHRTATGNAHYRPPLRHEG